MNKFWIILSHTYMSRVKTKSFLIGTLITLLLIFGISNIQSIIDMFSDNSSKKIAVMDDSEKLFKPLESNISTVDDTVGLKLFTGSEDEAKEAVQEEEYEAFVKLSLSDNQMPEAHYYADNITNSDTQMLIEQQLQQVKVSMATEQAGIDQATLQNINAPVTFQTKALDKDAKTDEELSQARGIVYIMLFVLYIAVIMYGSMIATDVATEKSSRVMELLVSSAPPVTHMFAKIIGIALLGLTQVILVVGVGYALIVSKQGELTEGFFSYFGIQNTSPALFIYAIIFFLLGYLLYATLAAMLGSLVSRVEDVQQLILPMTFLIMIAFFIAMFGLNMPESKLVIISSYIPFFSPMLMFLRVGMMDVPVWEVSISIGILIATIVLLAVLGARVYKGGVLMYGRSSSLKDLKKAIALSKKE
ncbi:ABC transporter permease [Virgibacillus alimentarius]|uniref:ABC-2 type transport system permease protein n=1 Tax=Virgibacillus alimentarius TaxID=698769 RepID=A0ABS4S8M1_9BACI|nr:MULTISPECIES: ABC transporter permease [Virgibacillus]MBP2257834.1 ABC-2 type transport system permease protein [Virgibacillus alimentarius]HLR66558.1 ABC transporter permease [Virgibacillus sp.]